MAIGKLKSSKSNKFRTLAVLLAIITIVIGSLLTFWSIRQKNAENAQAGAQVKEVPSIVSEPGSTQSSEEFIRLQRQQNREKAQRAEAQGTSAVPTLTRTGRLGPQLLPTQMPEIEKKQRRQAHEEDCTPEKLKLARETGVSASELEAKGCTVVEVRQSGYTLGEMAAGGFTAPELRIAGYTAPELRNANFSAKSLSTAGFSPKALKDAGYTAAQLIAADIGLSDLSQAGYSAEALKLAGMSAPALHKAGISIEALKEAGYTAAELKNVGFNPLDLSQIGYSTPELVAAGYSDKALFQGKIPAADIAKARKLLGELGKPPKNCEPDTLAKARQEGISAETIKASLDCPPDKMKAAGYSAATLKIADYTPSALKNAGFTASDLRAAGFPPAALKSADFSAPELKQAGITLGELSHAKFSPKELLSAGFTADDIRKVGAVSPKALKQNGVSAPQLKNAGYTEGDLFNAGYSPEEIAEKAEAAAPISLLPTTATPTATSPTTPSALLPTTTATAPTAAPTPATIPTVSAVPAAIIPAAPTAATPAPTVSLLTTTAPSPVPAATPTPPAAATPPATTDLTARVSGLSAILGGRASAPATLSTETPEANPVEQEITETTPPSAGALPVLPSPEARSQELIDKMQQRQEEQRVGQEHQEQASQFQAGMTAQANDLISSWSPPPTQQFVAGLYADEETKKASIENGRMTGEQTASSEGQASSNTQNGSTKGLKPGQEIIKAGDVIFAVLDTSVNSDEDSPVLATVVQGSLKGSKLLGKFTRVDKRVLLSFSTMSVPDLPKSISINTVAIDPDTARTAMASDVDNHYMLRYGTLFASSFLAGLGQAISQSGSTVVIEPFGSSIITNPHTSVAQQGLIALGNVGTQYANVLGRNFNTPPTVTVDAGQGLGLLFMSDLVIPPREQKTPLMPLIGEREPASSPTVLYESPCNPKTDTRCPNPRSRCLKGNC